MSNTINQLNTAVSIEALALPNQRALDLSQPVVMGIVNVTPDSFSDGGKAETTELAIKQAQMMIDSGAQIIDIGGESTRPGADLVSEADELARVLPVVQALRKQSSVAISVDTYKSAVAKHALDSGADIINDISAGRMDEKMVPLIAETDAAFVMMHMQGTPQTMQVDPQYADVVTEVAGFLKERLDYCASAGINSERLVIDPGIGFGKTLEHNLALLDGITTLTALGAPVLIGASRKSFIGRLEGEPAAPDQRLGGSIAAALAALAQGARILRVHDVRETVQALKVFSAISASSRA